MNKFFTSLVILVSILVTHASAQEWKWAQRLGNLKSDKITCVKTDDSGYIYIAGYFSTSTPVGINGLMLTFTANTQSKEAFIAKLDSTGYCYWAKSGGEYFDDRVLGMDVDKDGNSIIVGTYWSNNFNMGSININNSGFGGADQCFVVRHDRLGNEIWGTFVSSNSGDDQGLDVATDIDGNSYIVGHMAGNTLYCGGNTVTATNANTLYQQHSYWLTKINASGTFQWAKCFGNLPFDTTAGKYMERDIAVCVDFKGGVYVTGGYDHTRPFGNTTLTSTGGYDIFVMKYDTAGNFKWVTNGGSKKDDWSNGIASDKKGFVYVTGEHRDSLIMDTVLVKNYDGRDIFVLKIDDNTGKPIWGKRAGGDEGGERGNDVWADSSCNIYVCGDVNDGAKFSDDIIMPTGKQEQAFVAKISPEGKWLWAVSGGGSDDNDRGNAIVKGKGAQIYTGGYFRTPSQYGPFSLSSVGSSDAFVARLHDSIFNIAGPFKFSMPSKTFLCIGDTIKWTVPDHNYFNITPTTGIIFNSDSTKLKFVPTANTTYVATGYGLSDCPEYDTISFTILVGNPPFIINTPSDTILCTNESIDMPIPAHDNLSVTPMTGVTINASQTNINFKPTSNITYTIIGSSGGVCPSADTVVFTAIGAAQPVANFDLLPAFVLMDNPTFTFSNTSTGATKHKWYNENSLFSISTYTSFTAKTAGKHCYKLVVESEYGCLDSITKCGDVIGDERVFFPNAFTPNYDKVNDNFKPVILNIDLPNIKDYSFKVFNRYGQVMYETKDPYFGWDGNYGGKRCDIGTYYYTCSFTTPIGKKYDMKGDVTLLK